MVIRGGSPSCFFASSKAIDSAFGASTVIDERAATSGAGTSTIDDEAAKVRVASIVALSTMRPLGCWWS